MYTVELTNGDVEEYHKVKVDGDYTLCYKRVSTIDWNAADDKGKLRRWLWKMNYIMYVLNGMAHTWEVTTYPSRKVEKFSNK